MEDKTPSQGGLYAVWRRQPSDLTDNYPADADGVVSALNVQDDDAADGRLSGAIGSLSPLLSLIMLLRLALALPRPESQKD